MPSTIVASTSEGRVFDSAASADAAAWITWVNRCGGQVKSRTSPRSVSRGRIAGKLGRRARKGSRVAAQHDDPRAESEPPVCFAQAGEQPGADETRAARKKESGAAQLLPAVAHARDHAGCVIR